MCQGGLSSAGSRPMSASGCVRFGLRAAGPGHTCPVGLDLTWAGPAGASSAQLHCARGQEVPRTTQPGNLGEQGHVHRGRQPRMGVVPRGGGAQCWTLGAETLTAALGEMWP